MRRLAILLALVPGIAFASTSASFGVGAHVVSSARVGVASMATSSGKLRVQLATQGARPPQVWVGSEQRPLTLAGDVVVGSANGDVTVTLHY